MNFNKKDAVADAVDSVLQQEALKGNQKKIDKNHNNKIDSDDFKILRGEKKVSEEIDVNDASEDDIGGQKKVKRKDDVGPSGNFKPSKVRFHAGPKNESLEEPLEKVLADTAPHSGVIKTVMATDELNDPNKASENKTKLKMKEESEQLDEKNWIAGAIKKPGAMTAAAKREGKSTSEYIKSHEHEGGKAGKRARLAKTLKSFKEQYGEHSIYDQLINEVLGKDASAGDWIHDFVHSDNPKFAGKSKEMRKKMALAAYYAKQRNEEVETKEDTTVQESVEQIDEVELKTKTAYVPYVYTDRHGSGFGGNDVHYSKEADAHAHLARHGHMEINGKKGWVEKHELAKHPHTGSWVEANHLRRHGLAEESEQVEEGWDDMLKSVKDRAGPQPSGGAGVKKGRAYGGAAQKSKPEQEEEPKKKVNEAKRPEDDSVPFDPPYHTSSDAVTTDKSGAQHTPMSRAKHLARLAMKRVKKDLGKK